MGILAFLFAQIALAGQPVVIAVIDTGYSPRYGKAEICTHISSYNATTDRLSIPKDEPVKHGTHMVGIISQQAELVSHCFVIIKYYSELQTTQERQIAIRRAINYLIDKNIDVLNYSSAGDIFDKSEENAFKKLLNKGIMINVAAGNNGEEITDKNPVYPAMYDSRINVISCVDFFCNTGKFVDHIEKGSNVCVKDGCSTGTSAATALFTGKQIKRIYEKKNR